MGLENSIIIDVSYKRPYPNASNISDYTVAFLLLFMFVFYIKNSGQKDILKYTKVDRLPVTQKMSEKMAFK